MTREWFHVCPHCGQTVIDIAECDIPANVHAYPIIRDMPIHLVACLRCSTHEWYVIAYKTNIRDVVYQNTDGSYTRLEQRTLTGNPDRN